MDDARVVLLRHQHLAALEDGDLADVVDDVEVEGELVLVVEVQDQLLSERLRVAEVALDELAGTFIEDGDSWSIGPVTVTYNDAASKLVATVGAAILATALI